MFKFWDYPDPEADERVRAGMALLDERVPGWRDRVNRRRLDLSSMRKCPLGQIYGSFATALDVLHIAGMSNRYGFLHDSQVSSGRLTSAWKRALK